MNAANRIEHFTIMRIREEHNLNVIFLEHFVRIELEHFLSMRVHESNIFMIPAFKKFEMFDYLIIIYCKTHYQLILGFYMRHYSESQSESIGWRPTLGIAISEGAGAVCIRTEHTGHTARLLLEPVCLCIVGSIAPHRLPTQLSFVYQLAAPLQVRAPV